MKAELVALEIILRVSLPEPPVSVEEEKSVAWIWFEPSPRLRSDLSTVATFSVSLPAPAVTVLLVRERPMVARLLPSPRSITDAVVRPETEPITEIVSLPAPRETDESETPPVKANESASVPESMVEDLISDISNVSAPSPLLSKDLETGIVGIIEKKSLPASPNNVELRKLAPAAKETESLPAPRSMLDDVTPPIIARESLSASAVIVLNEIPVNWRVSPPDPP